jgi:hypothetical protein
LRCAADKSVNLFLQVDKGFFHATATIGRATGQSKPVVEGGRTATPEKIRKHLDRKKAVWHGDGSFFIEIIEL